MQQLTPLAFGQRLARDAVSGLTRNIQAFLLVGPQHHCQHFGDRAATQQWQDLRLADTVVAVSVDNVAPRLQWVSQRQRPATHHASLVVVLAQVNRFFDFANRCSKIDFASRRCDWVAADHQQGVDLASVNLLFQVGQRSGFAKLRVDFGDKLLDRADRAQRLVHLNARRDSVGTQVIANHHNRFGPGVRDVMSDRIDEAF